MAVKGIVHIPGTWLRHQRARHARCLTTTGRNGEQFQSPRLAVADPYADVGLGRLGVVAILESADRQSQRFIPGREELQPSPSNRFVGQQIEKRPQARSASYLADFRN